MLANMTIQSTIETGAIAKANKNVGECLNVKGCSRNFLGETPMGQKRSNMQNKPHKSYIWKGLSNLVQIQLFPGDKHCKLQVLHSFGSSHRLNHHRRHHRFCLLHESLTSTSVETLKFDAHVCQNHA